MSARLVRASTTVRPALARKAGAAEFAKLRGRHPFGLRSAERQINPQGVLEIEPVGQAIGWQRGAAAGKAASRSGGSLEATSRAIGRASLPSCSRMSDDEPGGAVASMNASTRVPGASTSAPPRARNGSAGWPSRAMTPDIVTLYFQSNDIALAPIDEAKPQAFIGAGWDIQRESVH